MKSLFAREGRQDRKEFQRGWAAHHAVMNLEHPHDDFAL